MYVHMYARKMLNFWKRSMLWNEASSTNQEIFVKRGFDAKSVFAFEPLAEFLPPSGMAPACPRMWAKSVWAKSVWARSVWHDNLHCNTETALTAL